VHPSLSAMCTTRSTITRLVKYCKSWGASGVPQPLLLMRNDNLAVVAPWAAEDKRNAAFCSSRFCRGAHGGSDFRGPSATLQKCSRMLCPKRWRKGIKKTSWNGAVARRSDQCEC
jgi:hypothetical protein